MQVKIVKPLINYKNRPNKRKYQKILFKDIKYTTFIGLLGTDLDEYLATIGYRKYVKYIFIDINKKIVNKQKKKYKDYKNITIINTDINIFLSKYINDNKTFYDFDYCCTIKNIEKHLPNIIKINNFSLTISTRGCSIKNTFFILRKYINKDITSWASYRDSGHSPMLMITKYNNNENLY